MNKLPKLDLNITNRCNLRCVHCAFDSGVRKVKEFSVAKIREILMDTKELGGERIDVTGGEPLVRKDVFEIIKIAKELGYRVELVTNGILLNKSKLLRLKQLKLDSIAVSLDGSTYEVHSRIRNVSREQYDKVKKNIELAAQLGFRTKVNTVVFESNMEDLPNITSFCIKNKLAEHGIYYFTPIGRGNRFNERSVEPLKWLRFVRANLAKFKDSIKLSIEFPLIEKGLLGDKIGCIANNERYHLQILPDGNVYPCAILASYHKPIADLNKVSVKDIWNNKPLWDKYWKEITKLFCGESCVNFKEFKTEVYKGYKFVCPLRKFLPQDIGDGR